LITGPRGTVKLARKLRSEMTLPEGLLWRELRQRPGDFKFRRQHPAGLYVIDFYCAAAKLAIEVDGFAHATAEVMQRDAAKSRFLRSQGVATLRVPDKAILQDIQAALVRIVEVCDQRLATLALRRTAPLHHPADGPPPPVGEE
jgi:very-short-patch-repair endonuclease